MERNKLIKARKINNLTQEDVARILGISTVYVRKIEKGNSNPGRETMLKFQELYDMPSKVLFPDLFQVSIDTKCIKNKIS